MKKQKEITEQQITEPKWDARALSALVCCKPKWAPIYRVLETLTPEEKVLFKKDLLKCSGLSNLHPDLDKEFDEK